MDSGGRICGVSGIDNEGSDVIDVIKEIMTERHCQGPELGLTRFQCLTRLELQLRLILEPFP